MLRARIAAVVVLVFVFYGLLDFGLHRMVVAPNFRRLEEESVRRDVQRVVDAFLREQTRLDQVSLDYASFQQIRALVAAEDRDGIRAALGEVPFRENRCELMFVVNAKSEILWSGHLAWKDLTAQPAAYPTRSGTAERWHLAWKDVKVQPPDADLSAAVLARFTTFSSPRDSTRGVLVVKGTPMLIAARPVVDADGQSIKGAVIVGRGVAEQVVADVRHQTGCRVSVSADMADILGRIDATTPWYVGQRTDETIEGVTTLADVDGQPALAVRVDLPREGVHQGMRASRFAMLSIVCTGVALLMLVLGLLETVVFSRVQRLGNVIEQIGESGDLSVRLPDVGRDEISNLNRNLNRMLAELQSAEKRLRESEQRYRSLFEGASDGILVLKEQRVVDCNAMAIKMFGPDKQQIIGHLFYRFLPPVQPDGRDSRREWPILTDAVMREGSRLLEWRFRRLDGSVMDAEVILAKVSSGADEFIQVMVRDLTARREAEVEKRHLQAQVMQSQKLESLGILAGGIAHDFNNMLVAVLGNADLALQELPADSPGRTFLEEIRKAAMRASELTNQMLAYSGRGRLTTQVIDVNAIVSEMTQLMQVSVSKKVALRFELAEKLPAVEVDLSQFRQVIVNLVTNASEAIGDRPGAITVRTGVVNADTAYLSQTYINEGLREGQYVFIEIADTGCGMDAETKARVFDPFFTTKFAGRGLGLATVLGSVRGHKGAIHVYSEVGRGTTMKVLLPVSPKGIEAKPDGQPTSLLNWKGSGMVLVADDEEAMRSICRMMLEKSGFTVVTANDGQDAVEKFRKYSKEIVVVLLDLTMPRLSGEETYEELVRIRPGIPVILCSGYNESEACRRFGQRPISGFVQKPFEYQGLMRKLRAVVQGQPKVAPPPAGAPVQP